MRFEPSQRSLVIDGQPDVVLQGNGIFLEHYSQTKALPRAPQTVTVTFREVGFIVDLEYHVAESESSDNVSMLTLLCFPPDSLHGVALMGSRALVSTS